ncbi:MAG TPA: hypothetical protein ENN23_10040 [Deltaproteobacteria bacterium]|nr:hypothetical protein [Deltaproteobacteria bacterium]
MSKTKFIILNVLIAAMFAFIAFAQEQDAEKADPPSEESAAETEASIQQQIASIAQMTGVEYSYNPAGKPDPFRPFIDITPKKPDPAPAKDDKKPIASIFPLQRIATENFRLVGIAGDEMRRVAVVEDAGRKFYPLFRGTHIGNKGGRVVDIMADRVVVEEREGGKTKRVILKLRKD